MDTKSVRKNYLVAGVLIIFTILAARLFYIQIIDDEYKINAGNNALKYETRYPARGQILDRNGNPLVGNKIIYDIMVTPREVKTFDTAALCAMFDLDSNYVKEKFKEFRQFRSKIGYQTLPFIKQVNSAQYNVFAEQAANFPGFEGIARSARYYPYNAGANLIGYVSEVDDKFLEKHPEYKVGDYTGRTGIEETRENDLKGQKGYTIYLRDSKNRILSHYKDGEYDIAPVPGKDIMSTIDAPLQQFGEKLMKDKVGSVVAIEPSTGEILALVSSPCIDVNVLSEINKHYGELVMNPYKPMYNRAVMSTQPPGSVFKICNGLIGLQEGTIRTSSRFPCSRGYHAGNVTVGCHNHRSPLDFYEAIMMSCNSYFCYVLRTILDNKKYTNVAAALDKWCMYVKSFGFGTKLGTDFPSEQSGYVPDAAHYNKVYGKGGWHSLTVISLSIGQGEIGCTPLHLANFCATIANRGYYYIPHIVKDSPGIDIDKRFFEKHYTMVDTTYFEEVVKGMYRVVNEAPGMGETGRIAYVEGLDICGKTGTAQNPHGDDHSVFICFAPMDHPKIAVAAYVENAGFGATWAAPIASLMVEKYLKGEIAPGARADLENRIETTSLMNKVRVKQPKPTTK
jgi:Cell division protein FtsI/penicillin-binding protein 2